ncbi:MAG: Zn-binding domain-containing protein, partial [Candidatus Acidiferrales bacterium]
VGLLHALESVATLLLMCDFRDLGTAIGERPPSPGIGKHFTAKGAENAEKRIGPSTVQVRATEADAREERITTSSASSGSEISEIFEPNLYLYDAYPGGIGFSEPLYRVHDLLLRKTRELIAMCACEKGCPSCVGPAGEKSEHPKAAALAILERLCGRGEKDVKEVKEVEEVKEVPGSECGLRVAK